MPPNAPEHGSPEGLPRAAAALARRQVDFVVVGGWAAEAQGYDMGYKTTDIADVIRSKQAANRPKDLRVIPLLQTQHDAEHPEGGTSD